MKPSSLQDETNQNSTNTTKTKPSSNTKQHENDQTQQQQQALNCPRCDSTNTKFCYYNNYSLTQPRYFCKTCRRYWTKGGALRNVPVGGGCRKTKKLKSSSSSSALVRNNSPAFEFFAGISPPIDFQMNGPLTNYSFMGLNSIFPPIHHANVNTNSLASSIESLSSINQDLHWKLQQQRLAMIFGGHDQVQNKDQNQKLLQPILFQNLEVPKQDGCFNNHHDHPRNECAPASTNGDQDATTTEWFFGNSSNYDHQHHDQVSSTNNSSSNIAGSAGGSGWNWGDLHHFTALP